MSWAAAILPDARRDLRRRWWTLVVLGAVADLVGGAVVGTLAISAVGVALRAARRAARVQLAASADD
jgi:uncharacterized membrane protein HdeD (DUF308 family)